MRQHVLSIMICLGLALGLSGCSFEQGGTGDGSPNSSRGVTIDSVNEPAADGYFRAPLLSNPPDLDPILVSDTTSDGVATKLLNTLVGYDRDLNLVPELAASLPTISPDGRDYTFELRKGVRFHNGREMVADDVKYSLTRLAHVRSKRFSLIEQIEGAAEAAEAARNNQDVVISGITVLGSHSLRIRLVKPHIPFIYHLAMLNTAVVPREVVEAKGDAFSRAPVGTGPFKLVEWKENDRLELERFDDYFKGKPKLPGIRLRVIPDILTRQQEYQAGNLEMLDVLSGMYGKWQNSNHGEDVTEWPALSLFYFGFNMEKDGSPLAGRTDAQALKLRQAFNYAVDREHICKNILENRYFPANGIIPAGMPGHDASRPAYAQDLGKAKALLAEAGYPEGKGLGELMLWFNQQGDNAAIAQAVQGDLRAIGVDVQLKMLDWAAYIDAADAGEPAFFRLGWVADYPDPENFLTPLFHSKNKGPQGNVSFYGSPEVDARLDASNIETDTAKRLALLSEAEDLILKDSPWLFLMFQKEVILLKPYVRNFHPTAMDDDVNCSQVEWHMVDLDRSAPNG